jgi:hypothetical protein
MNFDQKHYVPCLQWKQAEYQAIFGLSSTARNLITPLIEVPEIGFDFETRSETKDVDEHLAPFANRLCTKWGRAPCFVDVVRISPDKLMADGRHPVSFVFDTLRIFGCSAEPVTGIARDLRYQRAIKRVVSKDARGLALRLKIDEAARPNAKEKIDELFAVIGADAENWDLILDLGAPNFVPVEGFTKMIEALIRRLPYLPRWRTFTVIGTSFPSTMAEIKRSLEMIPRWEWILYNRLVANLSRGSIRVPTFGDYAINHPDPLSLDMRLVKPSASIRYAIDDGWLIVKGPNVRDNRFDQYRGHCQTVINSGNYMGPGFSQGDKYINACAKGGKTGNLTTWRNVGTNHHIEKVVRDVSSLFGSSGAP